MNHKESTMRRRKFIFLLAIAILAVLVTDNGEVTALQQRNMVSYLRGPYNADFFYRHNEAFRVASAIHIAHGRQHDILELTPLSRHQETDGDTDAEYMRATLKPPRTEPTMELMGPYSAMSYFSLYRAIDWTHIHHEQTYDILSEKSIPWEEKKKWTDRAVRYYLDKFDIPRSPAPLDVTMRRAGVMMKPYTTLFRNYYPHSNNFFYAAHWWHPVIYEAMMVGGNGEKQDSMVRETDQTYFTQVLADRPQRMLLSRELMPRYSRLSPESANIFDNLHMLHGIAYDILTYEGWSAEEKKAELDRVIEAMSARPGDERLARKFPLPHPDIDPRNYMEWMKGTEGEMNRIMKEMMDEMMPMMMPQKMEPEMHEKIMAQFKMKLTPGLQEGELPGSLGEVMQAMMPEMKMMPESLQPGVAPTKMIDMMLRGWQEKYGGMADVEPLPMQQGPAIHQ
ncbi:MAG: hypothetical protein ACD_75C00458G0001 [uncultured bacterium]|nr:MAG: hypothetical protein ACD_75C00458G0001 [uncultured bacterium]HBG20428.1 hypothetical protein [Desulfobulbaceae bacterium]